MRVVMSCAALLMACGGTAPPAAPGSSEAVLHNLDGLNAYRAQAGAPPLALDDRLSTFAAQGSVELAAGGDAHGHFHSASSGGALWSSGFCQSASENQAPGWP